MAARPYENVSPSAGAPRGGAAGVLAGGLWLWLLLAQAAAAKDVYIAQNTQGNGAATNAASAQSVSWFNTSANWGSGSGQISPGDTVHLVGTLTTALTAQSGGAPGSPITILFEPGANLTAPYWSPQAISLQSFSYLVVDGGVNGLIQCTANGTALANQAPAAGVGAQGNNITVQNLIITNIYVRTAGAPDDMRTAGVGFQNSGLTNLIVRNCTISWCFVPIWVGWSGTGNGNIQIYSNTLYGFNWGIGAGDQQPHSVLNGLYLHNNVINGMTPWDDPSDLNHHNGIFTWAVQGGSTLTNLQVYNNLIGPDFGTPSHATAGIYISAQNSVIANPLVYNNVLYTVSATYGVPSNGFISLALVTGGAIFNNTTDGGGGSTQTIGARVFFGRGVSVMNNIFSNNGLAIYNDGTTTNGTAQCDYNDYYNDSGNFYYSGGQISYASWKGLGYDAHSLTGNPLYVNAPALNFNLQAGSPCINAGASQTAAFSTDLLGNARPSGSGWTIGAYQYGAAPTPPGSLHVMNP
jgi:hypothetical protein